jgi:WD40 repeat protein
LSPDGKTLAVEDKNGARLSDTRTGKRAWILPGSWPRTQALVFSPDGNALAVADGTVSVRLWNVGEGRRRAPNAEPAHPVHALQFAPDGRSLVSAGGHRLSLWDVGTGKIKDGQAWGRGERFGRVAFRPDGKGLVASDWGAFRLLRWDRPNWRERRDVSLAILTQALAFSPDGNLLVAAETSAGGRLVAPSITGMLLWDARSWKEVRAFPAARARWFVDGVESVSFSPDGQAILTGHTDRALCLWDVGTGKLRYQVENKDNWSGLALFSPDGRTLAAVHRKGGVLLVEAVSGKARARLATEESEGPSIAFSPDGRALACGNADGSIDLWALSTGTVWHRLAGHTSAVSALAFSPDGKTLASGSTDSTILLWRVPAWPPAGPAAPLSRSRQNALWADLGGEDAPRAYRAIRDLTTAPDQAVPLLRARLRPAPAPSAGQLKRLLAGLDDEEFVKRERATAALAALGRPVAPTLRRALASRPPLEARRRLERLLGEVSAAELSPAQVREVRAVEVLEAVGSPEARRLLRALAGGSPATVLTQEARAALARLGRRPAAP